MMPKAQTIPFSFIFFLQKTKVRAQKNTVGAIAVSLEPNWQRICEIVNSQL